MEVITSRADVLFWARVVLTVLIGVGLLWTSDRVYERAWTNPVGRWAYMAARRIHNNVWGLFSASIGIIGLVVIYRAAMAVARHHRP